MWAYVFRSTHTTGLNIVKDAVQAKAFKIMDPATTTYREPTEWERIFLMEPGQERDFAIANLFNKQYSRRRQIPEVLKDDPIVTYNEHGMPLANKNKLEPGVSHDLEDRSLKVTIPDKYYHAAQADEAAWIAPQSLLSLVFLSSLLLSYFLS
jgi:hypothetical protein